MKESNLIKKESGTDKIFYKESVLWFANILFYRLKFFSFLPLFPLRRWSYESHAKFKKLTLLHSNDLHGDFLAEQVDDKLVGGVSMLSGYINQVRQTEKNVIYAIAGDMFRGSIIDSEYKGISTIEIMNALAPDIATVGNHELDYGIPHLLFIEKCAQFPIINANLFIKTNHARLFPPCYIMELDGMKILFIGIITDAVLAQAK